MPGALGPARHVSALGSNAAAIVAARPRTAYEAGLSHFPDAAGARAPLGFVAAAYTALKTGEEVYNAFTAGSQIDTQRKARADYFGQLAINGNVAAAQILLGGTQNTSSNERPYWQSWIDQLRTSSSGQQTLGQAQQLGAWWPVGSSDTVTSYPIMKQYAATWAAQHPLQQMEAAAAAGGAAVAGAVSSPVAPWVLGGGLLVAAVVLSRRRRR